MGGRAGHLNPARPLKEAIPPSPPGPEGLTEPRKDVRSKHERRSNQIFNHKEIDEINYCTKGILCVDEGEKDYVAEWNKPSAIRLGFFKK